MCTRSPRALSHASTWELLYLHGRCSWGSSIHPSTACGGHQLPFSWRHMMWWWNAHTQRTHTDSKHTSWHSRSVWKHNSEIKNEIKSIYGFCNNNTKKRFSRPGDLIIMRVGANIVRVLCTQVCLFCVSRCVWVCVYVRTLRVNVL